jgi:23S rRNA pseudoU1915 N3-methylase RlmH
MMRLGVRSSDFGTNFKKMRVNGNRNLDFWVCGALGLEG